MAEKVSDYFAACVLMPKAWVKDAFCNQGIQSVEALAELFQVSSKAMSFRLSQLGLTLSVNRCAIPVPKANGFWSSSQRQVLGRNRYFRSLPTLDFRT